MWMVEGGGWMVEGGRQKPDDGKGIIKKHGFLRQHHNLLHT